jgi:hypothetical protein
MALDFFFNVEPGAVVLASTDWLLLSMTDLFSYLLPYPASVLRSDSDPNLNFLVSLLVLLIEKAMFGRFKKIIPRYQTEGVSIQSHLQLDVRLDSHMVLQQLLFQLNW